ncbi:pyridoxal 5'-phosphate synthase glutaminase subunit PdxT [Nocardioides sp. W3-2-3]|uniref:pyridoxal 5'-phosphate synthase glutaminase subunit PdxT n=1 Tax=Nocardioides convexus TaxID=2712224 RepID=UPI002418B44A|nr:pyridoxal 5'-phosphate synthase glutaminase subunit PdxT [Nocardioides convexus]NGZ99693.1 pyridoxal 5'-phosphate synthase glutaminase subunit PdxT [Nocardioides convexus]
MPAIGVFALQGDVREHLQTLTALGADAFAVRRPGEARRLRRPGAARWGVDDDGQGSPAPSSLLDPLRERIAGGMPTFGTCAGMILLADRIEDGTADQETIGGLDVTVRRNAFGRQVDSFEADLEFAGLGDPVHAVFIRAPWVEATGPGVEVLAEAAGHPVAVRQGTPDGHLLPPRGRRGRPGAPALPRPGRRIELPGLLRQHASRRGR